MPCKNPYDKKKTSTCSGVNFLCTNQLLDFLVCKVCPSCFSFMVGEGFVLASFRIPLVCNSEGSSLFTKLWTCLQSVPLLFQLLDLESYPLGVRTCLVTPQLEAEFQAFLYIYFHSNLVLGDLYYFVID